jgi:hypothetical protein
MFFAVAISLRIGRNAWQDQPLLSPLEGLGAALLPAVFAGFLTFRSWKRTR